MGVQPVVQLAVSPRLSNLKEVGQLTGGLGRNFLTREINCGRLRAVAVGKGWKVPAEWLAEYIELLKIDQVARPSRPVPSGKRGAILPASFPEREMHGGAS